MLRDGLLLTIVRIALGLSGAAAVTRFLQGMLFGVRSLDALMFLGVAGLFGSVTMLASYISARRAMRVDLFIALRSE